MSTRFADLDHKATEEQLSWARARFEVERVMSTTITEDPEIITVPGDLDPRVARGVEWLDNNIEDWSEKIDLPTFDITHVDSCVIGQVAGSYWACDRLGIGGGERYTLGFNSEHGGMTDYQKLQKSWVRAIKFRQAHP